MSDEDDILSKELAFDKFMVDIVKREENSRRKVDEGKREQDVSPQRRYNRLYRELPQNRVKFNGGK